MKKRILFVCTGNVFRSISAEYCLRKYLLDNNIKGYVVDSAGTIAKKELIEFKTRAVLKELCIKKVVNHQKRLTKKMLENNDIIIAMAKVHVDFIKSKFNFKNIFLFNELALDKKTSIWDINDKKIPVNNKRAIEQYIEKTIKEIHQNTPKLFKNIEKI